MKEFDINEIKVGDVLQCKDPELNVEIVCKDAGGAYPIIGLLIGYSDCTGIDYKRYPCYFDKLGVSECSSDSYNGINLVMPEHTESVDVYLYRGVHGEIHTYSRQIEFDTWNTFGNSLVFLKKVTIQI